MRQFCHRPEIDAAELEGNERKVEGQWAATAWCSYEEGLTSLV